MGKRSSRNNDVFQFKRCNICGSDMPIDSYCDEGDIVFCEDCSSEYLVDSRYPLRLTLIAEDYEDNIYGDLDFD